MGQKHDGTKVYQQNTKISVPQDRARDADYVLFAFILKQKDLCRKAFM